MTLHVLSELKGTNTYFEPCGKMRVLLIALNTPLKYYN